MDKKEIVKSKGADMFPMELYNPDNLKEIKVVSFTGSPSKHPTDSDKFILICDPLSDHTEFIEFYKKDVAFVKDIPSVFSEDENNNITLRKVWIKEGSLALKMQPFIVAKTNFSISK